MPAGTAGRKIQGRLEGIYNVEAPPGLISRVTDAVFDEAGGRRNRPLEKPYAAAYPDALRVRGREDGKSCLKSVYTALGVSFEGRKEVLGLRAAET
jgi:transposase-like protein